MCVIKSSKGSIKAELYEQLLSTIDDRFDEKGCPEGMVKIAHGLYNYWFPKDFELYQILFRQWCDLRIKNITPEERKTRETKTEEIRVKLNAIKARSVPISHPSHKIIEKRKFEDDHLKNIINSLKSNRRTEGNENPYPQTQAG